MQKSVLEARFVCFLEARKRFWVSRVQLECPQGSQETTGKPWVPPAAAYGCLPKTPLCTFWRGQFVNGIPWNDDFSIWLDSARRKELSISLPSSSQIVHVHFVKPWGEYTIKPTKYAHSPKPMPEISNQNATEKTRFGTWILPARERKYLVNPNCFFNNFDFAKKHVQNA